MKGVQDLSYYWMQEARRGNWNIKGRSMYTLLFYQLSRVTFSTDSAFLVLGPMPMQAARKEPM